MSAKKRYHIERNMPGDDKAQARAAVDKIVVRKGLDLPVDGIAERRLTDATGIALYAVKPADFVGLQPRLTVAEGDTVQAGTPLFVDKHDERIRFTSPVAGRVKAIMRGEKRRLLSVTVEKGTPAAENATPPYPTSLPPRELMLQTGLWSLLRQRPFGTVPSPEAKPKAIMVSLFDSSPLAPDYDFALQGREGDLSKGLAVLATLTEGALHICYRKGQRLSQQLPTHLPQLRLHEVEGPHPAGNIGTLIAHICPLNKGEQVWTMNPHDIATLGHLADTGEYLPERVVAVAGPQCANPHYYRIIAGAQVHTLVAGQIPNEDYPSTTTRRRMRIISGNMLSGQQIDSDGYIGTYDNMLTLLPEGDYYDFMGWLMPGVKKHSFSRTFLSGMLPRPLARVLLSPYRFDTNVHGSVRPLVFTGNFERVFPFDIYPLQLLKACIIGDVELMEKLGIYEVEPEDFALCEYIDPSKTDMQPIIREALETLRKEAL